MKTPLWTYALAALPLGAFYVVVGLSIGWWTAAAIFVVTLLLTLTAVVIGVRRRRDAR
jgi:uncharacterized membrane protein YhaH (DUF805 family)